MSLCVAWNLTRDLRPAVRRRGRAGAHELGRRSPGAHADRRALGRARLERGARPAPARRARACARMRVACAGPVSAASVAPRSTSATRNPRPSSASAYDAACDTAASNASGADARARCRARRVASLPSSSSFSRTKGTPRRAVVRQWMSRGSSPGRKSRSPKKSPSRLRHFCWLPAVAHGQAAQHGGRDGHERRVDDAPRRRPRRRATSGRARRGTSSTAGTPRAGAARAARSCGGRPSPACARPAASGSSSASRSGRPSTRSSTSTENDGSRRLRFDSAMPIR